MSFESFLHSSTRNSTSILSQSVTFQLEINKESGQSCVGTQGGGIWEIRHASAEMRREVFRKRMTAQSFGRSLWLSFVSGTFVARHSLGGSANQVSARTNRPRGRSRRSPSPEETSVIAATWKEGSEWKVSEPVRDVSISLPKPSKTNREGKRNITR